MTTPRYDIQASAAALLDGRKTITEQERLRILSQLRKRYPTASYKVRNHSLLVALRPEKET